MTAQLQMFPKPSKFCQKKLAMDPHFTTQPMKTEYTLVIEYNK